MLELVIVLKFFCGGWIVNNMLLLRCLVKENLLWWMKRDFGCGF